MSPVRRLWNIIRRARLDDELRREVDIHLAMIEDEERANGGSDGSVRRRARARFGNALGHRERALDAVIATSAESLWKETGFAARRLLRSPAFTAAGVLTLALAIGANAAIFAVVERVLLNPLPYPDSDRIIDVDHGARRLNLPQGMGITRGYYYQYAERAHTLDAIAIYETTDETLTGDREPERIVVTHATPSLASVMRVWPAAGRWFTDEEGRPGAPPRIVLAHGLWVRRFGADPHVIGRTIAISGVSTEVVGVMPASFAFPNPRVDAWAPEPITRSMGFGIWLYNGVARLRDGVSVDDARREMDALIGDIELAFPGDPFARGNSAFIRVVATPRTIKERLVGGVAQGLWIVLASVGLVLLIACANVANLFLVRSDARQREVAVRMALGAGRAGLARYFLAESVLLSLTGGAVGLAIAWIAVRVLVANGPTALPRLSEIRLDAVSIAYTVVLTLLTAGVFGAMPLVRGPALSAALGDGGRGSTAGRTRHRARRVLMGAQVALALVLLVASALMIRSFQQLRAVDPGFNPSSALAFNVSLPAATYRTREAAVAAHQSVLDRLSALPGVSAASATTCLPLTFACYGNSFFVRGHPFTPDTTPPTAMFRAIAAEYFETMGIRLLRGRTITRADVEHQQPVIVVSDALARRVFPNHDPIGEYLISSAPPVRPGGPPPNVPLEIVGVAANVPIQSLAEQVGASMIYMPMSIAGGPGIPVSALVGPDVAVMNFVVRSSTPPAALLPAITRALDDVDPALAVAQAGTLQDLVDNASAQTAFTMVLLAIAGVIALALGVVGIYGVMSYIVSQRKSEIGVRLALGAEPHAVAAMILRQGSTVAGVGALIGLVASLAGGRAIASLLYGISPRDPVVFVATTALLMIVAALACWLPARAAARLDPVDALRAD